MVAAALPVKPAPAHPRSAIVATTGAALSEALLAELGALRWSVRAASSASAIFDMLEAQPASVCLVDSWLPDLDAHECVAELHALYPEMALLALDDGSFAAPQSPHPLRTEALHALRRAQARLDAPAAEAGTKIDAGADKEAYTGGRPGASDSAPRSAFLAQGSGEAAPALAPRQAGGCTLLPFAPAPANLAARRSAELSPAASPTLLRAGLDSDLRPELGPEFGSGFGLELVGVPAPAVPEASPALPEFLGRDPRLLEVSRRIRLVAARRTAVLVHGETGTGKELVARALHRLSGRAGKLVSVNCAAIPEALIESELFGHARGSFTGAQTNRVGRIEAAAGGTLFLDEVGELSLAAQAKLLRFLESSTIQRVGENEEICIDVRIVAATHRPLARMAKEGHFRLDLLHRLSVFLIQAPSLSGRTEDIDTLIDHALARFAQCGEARKRLSREAREALHGYSWPGNVRELQHTVERACILAGDQDVIERAYVDFGEALL